MENESEKKENELEERQKKKWRLKWANPQKLMK